MLLCPLPCLFPCCLYSWFGPFGYFLFYSPDIPYFKLIKRVCRCWSCWITNFMYVDLFSSLCFLCFFPQVPSHQHYSQGLNLDRFLYFFLFITHSFFFFWRFIGTRVKFEWRSTLDNPLFWYVYASKLEMHWPCMPHFEQPMDWLLYLFCFCIPFFYCITFFLCK